MSHRPYEPIRTQFGRGHAESANEYTLYRRFCIVTEDEEVLDDTFVILRFKPDQISQEDFISEIQTAIIDDLEALYSVRQQDWDNIAAEHGGEGDSDYELFSPFTQNEFISVDTLYALKTPQGQVFPLYEMPKTLKPQLSSEGIEMHIRKGLETVIKPEPILPDLFMHLRRS